MVSATRRLILQSEVRPDERVDFDCDPHTKWKARNETNRAGGHVTVGLLVYKSESEFDFYDLVSLCDI